MIPLLGPLLALIAGILMSPYLAQEAVWLCLPLVALLAFARRWMLLAVFFLLGSGLRSLEPEVPPDPGDVAVRLIGHIEQPPEWRGPGVYMDIRAESIDGRSYYGTARLTEFLEDPQQRELYNALQLGSGDRLEVLVKLHRPIVYRDPGVFDFRRHLERQGIYWTGTIRNPRLITVLDRGRHGRDRVRSWIAERLARSFSDNDVRGLVMGMVLGKKYGIRAETERLYQAGGIYHLVVVSGFNLAVISWIAFWICRFLPVGRAARLCLVLAAVLGYAAIVDGEAAVIRATLMVVFLIFGKLLDRGHAIANAICGAALIQLLIAPTALEDTGFQMTFAAVVAVVGLGMPAAKWAFGWLNTALTHFEDVERDGLLPVEIADWRVSRRLWCELHSVPFRILTVPWRLFLMAAEAAIVSVAVEAVFAVFMVESFHRLSPISPIVNVPAGIVAGVVTPAGLATIVLPDRLAFGVGNAIALVLHSLRSILEFMLKIPGSTFRVPSAPVWIWMLYGMAIAWTALEIHRRSRTVFASAGSVFVLQALIGFCDFSDAPPQAARLTFLDVGQGDSILVEFPNGKRMLIDGGGVSAGRFLDLQDESTFSIGENVVSPFLFSKGWRRVDILVLTHAHNDHLEGLLDVLRNFDVGELWLGRNPMVPAYRLLIELAQSKQVPIRWVYSGQRIELAPAWKGHPAIAASILHPPRDWRPRRAAENDDSVVLLLNTGTTTALLTGDIERAIPAPRRVDVLKVAHHGSKGVKLQVSARIRVISVGANNPFGHPDASTLPAFRTDQMGAIEVVLSDRPTVASLLTHPGH